MNRLEELTKAYQGDGVRSIAELRELIVLQHAKIERREAEGKQVREFIGELRHKLAELSDRVTAVYFRQEPLVKPEDTPPVAEAACDEPAETDSPSKMTLEQARGFATGTLRVHDANEGFEAVVVLKRELDRIEPVVAAARAWVAWRGNGTPLARETSNLIEAVHAAGEADQS